MYREKWGFVAIGPSERIDFHSKLYQKATDKLFDRLPD